jgi:integrase
MDLRTTSEMSKQLNPYAVKTVLMRSGERLPMLCARATGAPLFQPALWSLTELRARNRSTSTIQQALRGVMVLQLTLDKQAIDIHARLDEGRLLTLGEVELLSGACKLPLEVLCDRLSLINESGTVSAPRVRTGTRVAQVDALTAGIRLRYIRDYLAWLVTDRLLRMGSQTPTLASLQSLAGAALGAITARIPPSTGRTVVGQREGLSKECRERLISIIEPESPENPWPNEHARRRNYLVVRWLLSLGLRRGELLGVKVNDINFASHEVLIPRRADDQEDPRRNQPNAKTHDRLLALDADLAALTREYVLKYRRAIPGAKRHPFLWVATGTGAPLSLQAVNKMFVSLRRKFLELSSKLSPHILRHTWNEWFSEQMDQSNTSEEMEQKMRAQQMGWSDDSKMAATYLRRRIRTAANKASLQMQQKLRKRDPNQGQGE